jgi:lysophospholipase L1-like esterase
MPHIHREPVEWCDLWLTAADVAVERPRVLFIGDSITRGYYPVVDRLLGTTAACARCCTSRFLSDPVYFQELALILSQAQFAVIHFNNGLHGWDFTETEYAQGLPILVQYLRDRQPGAKLVWGQSTRVLDPAPPATLWRSQRGFGPDNSRVLARNRIADDVMAELGVAVDPLYAATGERPEVFSPDGVHYLPAGNEVLAAQVVEWVRPAL